MMNSNTKLQCMPQSGVSHNPQYPLELIFCHMQEIRGSLIGSCEVDEVEGCEAGLSPVVRGRVSKSHFFLFFSFFFLFFFSF